MKKQIEKERKRKAATKEVTLESDEEDQDDNKEENENESDWDDDEKEEAQPMKKKHKYLTKSELANMEKVFEEAERWNLSEQGTASMMNAMNAASGKITVNDQSKVMIPTSVHKLKKKFRNKKVAERMGNSPLAVGVDERIDKTKKETGEGMKGAKRYQVVKEEHATVIFWRGRPTRAMWSPLEGLARSWPSPPSTSSSPGRPT